VFQNILLYIPLSIIGLWRWSYWLTRVIGAALYRQEAKKIEAASPASKKLSISIVTPVYNEDDDLFKEALTSWIQNGVDEIVAVIDKSNTHHILNFERNYVPRKDVKCRLIVTPKPGKRAALCDGIEECTGDLIAVVDSDTVWSDNVRESALPYFNDPEMGGVTIAQRISNPDTISNVLFDMLLWNRYHEEVPFLLGLGKAYNTLSGRTAIYRREALINKEYDNVHDLMHEFFGGARAVSGDDKRLSHLILEQGWKVAFAKDAVVYTQGLGKARVFLKQRLRWTRNSWRADLRAIRRGWVFKYPVLAYFMLDRFVQPFFMLLGPTAAVIGIIQHRWLFVGVLVIWWFASRFVRLFSYFRHYPMRLAYLPAWIIYTYLNAIIKVYALATILENSWATRWHKSRMKRRLIRSWATMALGFVGIAIVFFFTVRFITQTNKQSAALIPQPVAVGANEFAVPSQLTTDIPIKPRVLPGTVFPTGVRTYTVQPGDSLSALASTWHTTIPAIKKLNGLPVHDGISVGQKLIYFVPATGSTQS
jgi:cellulose synthase/poly-beta-1,6-N-acetylglucosamine synthase-like glycosyltransferase